MRSTFTFNGHSCDEFGIYISKKPNINRSQRKFQSASVAGRNGNIYQLQDAWDEVVVTYDIFAGGYEQGDAPSDFTDIMEWLNSADDYAKLEDSYDTEHYRMAVFVDATNIEQKWYSTGQAQIKFRCKPQHFLDIPDVDVNNLRNYYMGEIVSFDGDGQNLENLTAEIEAVQDLHGYDHPWVGGAGKNKLPLTENSTTVAGVTVTIDKDKGTITLNGTATNLAWCYFSRGLDLPSGTGILNCQSTNWASLAVGVDNKNSAGITNVTSNNDASISALDTVGQAWVRLSNGETYSNVVLKPMIRLTGTSADFEPYTNICPISGWDEVNVNVSGVNVWDEEWEQGTFNNDTGMPVASTANIRSKNFIPVLPNTQYYSRVGGNSYLTRLFYDSAQNYITYQSTKNGVFTTPNNACYMKFRTEGGVYGNTYHNDISINYPSTDHDYHAYNGQTYTTDLDGTRYGGSLDVTTGVLTVTHELFDLGSTNYVYSSNYGGYFYVGLVGKKAGDTNIYADCYANAGVTSVQYMADSTIKGRTADSYIFIKDSRFTDAGDLKTALNGHYAVYELATPQVVQLTPTQVKTLVGENNIWVDSGEVDVVTAPSIANPTNHVALPIITLTGAGASSLLDLEKDSPDHNESGMPHYFSELLPCFGAVLTGMSGSQRYVSMFTDAYTAVDKLQIASRQNSTGSVVFTALNDKYGVGTAIEVNPNTDYTISASTDRPCTVQVLFFTGVVGLITSEAHASNNGGGLQLTFRTPSDCQKILIAFFASDTSQITVGSIMVSKGSEAQAFRPYQADTSETITIKDTTLKILMNGFKTAVIDCERENFSVDGADSNTSVSVLDQYGNLSDEYLKIDKGRNKVAYSDGIVSVMLKPRFWEL